MILTTQQNGLGSERARVERRGVTLLEVLAAIFIMGIGLLALLALFPVGALTLARAIQDDRAAAVAVRAEALSDAGREILQRTRHYVIRTFTTGNVDKKAAGLLKDAYEALKQEAADLEQDLSALRTLINEERLHRLLDALLAQINTIETGFVTMEALFGWLENYQP